MLIEGQTEELAEKTVDATHWRGAAGHVGDTPRETVGQTPSRGAPLRLLTI